MEDREATSADEREAVGADDDVEAHVLSTDDKGAVPADEDEERRAFPTE